MRMNKNRPYGHVFGLPGIAWQQDNHYFRHDGTPVDEAGNVLSTEVIARQPKKRSMDDDDLRQQMQVYNEPWTTAAAARRFLAGRDE